MNFDYLAKINDFQKLYSYCKSAENFVYTNPILSATSSRQGMEYVVKFLYSQLLGNYAYASSVFEGCKYLLYCDWHLAGSAEDWSKSNSNFFDGCEALKSDLVEMLPSGGFSRKVVSMKDTFKGCKSLLCNDWNYVGSILWNDSSTIWKNTENCFKDCDDNFRKHIPESWGGLKKVIYHDDVIVIRNMDEIYNLVSKLASSCELNMSLNNDNDLFNIIKEVAKQNDIEIKLDNDSQLVKSIETVVVSLGARQLVTLF